MLQNQTLKAGAKFLIFVGEEEECIEVMRQMMADNRGFESYSLFKYLDYERKSNISTKNIASFLESKEKYFEITLVEEFLKHYDLDFDENLSFSEFLRVVLPQENKTQRAIITQRPTSEEEPSFETLYSIARLFEKEINYQRKRIYKIQELIDCFYDFNLKEFFNCIDTKFNGFINFAVLKKFLKKQGFDPNDSLVIAILRRLDRNDDGKIDYEEFKLSFTTPTREESIAFSPSKPDSNFKSGNCDVCRYAKRRAKPSKYELEELSELLLSLKQMINLEKEVDQLRKDLALASDFNLHDFFLFFSAEKDMIGPKELHNGLKHILNLQRHEVYLLIRRFDFDGDNKLNRDEFSDIFVSRNEEFGKILISRKGYLKSNPDCIGDVFTVETINLLREFFQLCVENEGACEALKQRLNRRKNFNFKNLFILLDSDQDGILSIFDVPCF